MISAKLQNRALIALRVYNLGPLIRRRMQSGFEKRADRAISKMKDRVPVRKGALKNSIRREEHPKHYPGVRIIAGGTPETTRSHGTGKVYDEALLTEYGTVKEAAEPFFRPSIQEVFGSDAGDDIVPTDLENE